MSKDDIITLPNTHLRQKSQRVGIITPKIREVIAAMKEATIDWEHSRDHEIGVALAAIQIDQPYKIVVIRNNYNNKDDLTFTAFINPSITKFEGELAEDFEGCLSVAGFYGKVPRYTKVRVKAMNEHGREFRVTAEGFLARIFQHEIDHINGIVFVDHIQGKSTAFYHLDEQGELIPADYDKEVAHNKELWG